MGGGVLASAVDLLNVDFARGLHFLLFRDRDGQHAVLELRLDVVQICAGQAHPAAHIFWVSTLRLRVLILLYP